MRQQRRQSGTDWGEGGRTGTRQTTLDEPGAEVGPRGRMGGGQKHEGKDGTADLTGIDRDTLLYSLGNKRLDTSPLR